MRSKLAAAADNRRSPSGLLDLAAAETERRIGWLRLPAIGLAAATAGLPGSDAPAAAFGVGVALALAYGALALFWAYTQPVTPRLSIVATVCDVAVITLLVGLAGGPFSEARWAFFLVPIAVAFRFEPALTAGAGAASVVAFLVQAISDEAADESGAGRILALHAGYLLWLTAAATILSFLLRRRTERVGELLSSRQELMAEALSAEERERRALAEGLHNDAIQNLLSARHDLEEVAADRPHPSLDRADSAIQSTIVRLREAIFELHPQVFDEAGLAPALEAIGEQAARRGGFRLHLDLRFDERHAHERLLLAAARELLANAAAHSSAPNVTVSLHRDRHEVVLAVTDDGRGFDARVLAGRVREGHIGIASQRVRIESIGGRMTIRTRPGQGTAVEIRLPA